MTADVEWRIQLKERQQSVNDLWYWKYCNYTVLWLLLGITNYLAACFGKRVNNTVTTGVSNGSREHTSCPGLDWINPSVLFQDRAISWTAASGGPIQYLYLSTTELYRIWLDPLVAISSARFRVLLCMVAFRFPTVMCKILTLVYHCVFLFY